MFKKLLPLFLIIYAVSLWSGLDVPIPDPYLLLQNEPSITVNPMNPANIVIVFNEDPVGAWGITNGIGVSYSNDFGATWTNTSLFNLWGIEADPSIDADLNGNVFAGFISYKSQNHFTDSNAIFVVRSTDGGASWGNLVIIDQFLNSAGSPGPFTDKCYICVDNNMASPMQNNIYITWERDNVNGVNADVYFSYSNNGGTVFSTPQKISDLPSNVGQCVGQVPKTGPQGEVYVVWGDFSLQGHTTGYLFIDVSIDGGVTWGTDVLIDSFLTITKYPNPAFTGFYVRSYPTIGVDPMNPMHVYVAVAADPDGIAGPDDGDIYFWRSVDGGITWNGPVVVNDDGTTHNQFQPWMDVKDNGIIDVFWLDARLDPTGSNFETYIASSIDGGVTFLPNIPVSDVVFPLMSGQDWMGEYIAIDVDQNTAYLAWTDTRNGNRDIYFDTFTNPDLAVYEGQLDIFNPNTLKCFPNPFNSYTTISFTLNNSQFVNLKIFDVLGREIETLIDELKNAGTYSIELNASNYEGGIYFYEIRIDNVTEKRKLIIMN